MTYRRIPKAVAGIVAGVLHVTSVLGQDALRVEPVLGAAPVAPLSAEGLPASGPRKLNLTAVFSVNANSREQVRQFYNAVYLASVGVAIDSTADTSNCIAGGTSAAFQNAVLWRINWYRAMSGIPAGVTLSASESEEDQSAALMMSANDQLQHVGIPATWSCFSVAGTNAAANSNLSLGDNGPDAIDSFISDWEEPQLGHRRWILYPQTQVMATGDVPAQGSNAAANATWVFDANYGGPRPATPLPYVAWPPAGYAPYPVVFPQWSFALSNADFSAATVTMRSNGIPLGVVVELYQAGYGEDTLAWYPSNLVAGSSSTVFPFNGIDTVYTITVSNINTIAGPQSFGYTVTVIDPAVRGADYVPILISGTNRPTVNYSNPYSCRPSANPNVTGYQWVAAQSTDGNLADNALNGLTNFTISPPPVYPIITNSPVGAGKCFHLTHNNAVPQLLQLTEVLYPATNTSLSFKSLLGYATTNEVARVQVCTNDGDWVDLYAQAGTGGSGQAAFAAHTLSLSNCAGQITLLRFDYDFAGGARFAEITPDVGWCLEDIVITNANRLVNFATNATVSTNFEFVPSETGNWVLEATGVIFNQFNLDWSPAVEVLAVSNAAPTVVLLGAPALRSGQAEIPFTVMQGAASSFELLQASKISGPWTTNNSAVLSTLVPGASFQFTTPFGGAPIFYRVLAQ